VIFIYLHNMIAAINRVPPLWARFVAASLVPRAPRRVVYQVRRPAVLRALLLLHRLSVRCAIRVYTQTQ
jgi:hypothetical protein